MRLFFVRTFLRASRLAAIAGAERVARVAICLVLPHLDVVGSECIPFCSLEGLTYR